MKLWHILQHCPQQVILQVHLKHMVHFTTLPATHESMAHFKTLFLCLTRDSMAYCNSNHNTSQRHFLKHYMARTWSNVIYDPQHESMAHFYNTNHNAWFNGTFYNTILRTWFIEHFTSLPTAYESVAHFTALSITHESMACFKTSSLICDPMTYFTTLLTTRVSDIF